MTAIKRIPVREETWKLIEEKRRINPEEDIAEWEKDESVEFKFPCTNSE